LFTAGPVKLDQGLIGCVLVGTPLAQVNLSMARSGFADVSIYQFTNPTTSTFVVDEVPKLDDEIFADLSIAENRVPIRYMSVLNREYIEALTPIYLRNDLTNWAFGIALPESIISEVSYVTFWKLLIILITGLIVLALMGTFIAQNISLPAINLVKATKKIEDGNYQVDLDVGSRDELGILTMGFKNMVRGLQQRDEIRDVFGRMVSEDVAKVVLEKTLQTEGELFEAAVLFADIQGFTSFSEQNHPTTVISLLNDFFEIINSATQKHGGLINHFKGDSALIIFGVPIARPVQECITQAVLCSIDIRREIALYNADRVKNDTQPVRFGIGVDSGNIVGGRLGSKDRFEYSVIGDAVNVAARVQAIARDYPANPLMITSSCVEVLSGDSNFRFDKIRDFDVKGKSQPITVYHITALKYSNLKHYDSLALNFPIDVFYISVYLYCAGYPPNIISEALGANSKEVIAWLLEAATFLETTEIILRKEFDLSEEQLSRLKGLAIGSKRLKQIHAS